LIITYFFVYSIVAYKHAKIIFSCLYPYGKAGEIQIRRYQGIAVKCYGFTLGSESLWLLQPWGLLILVYRHNGPHILYYSF